MTRFEHLTAPGAPSIMREALSAAELEHFASWLAGANPQLLVRRIRGHKARTLQAWFDELGAALQLPGSFGEDWNALIDCARDLMDRGVVLLVTNAGWLLADAPDERAAFVTVLQQLHGEFAARGKTFRVILQESPGGLALLDAFAPETA
jgi:hypothetical protein